jgi:ACS family sodium-dependent inorganic phosphate cotransporter
VYADVKSEPYEILETVPESVKLEEDALDDAGLDSTVPWWEEFPKRWVIVILCFSAFLLCNMDRVCCPHLLFFFLFPSYYVELL